MKMYILIPDEVATSVATGKIMAHAAHNASIITYEHKGEQRVEDWYSEMTKIVVRTPWTIGELREFVDNMRRLKIPAAMIADLHIGTELCAAVGPLTALESDTYHLSGLKLF